MIEPAIAPAPAAKLSLTAGKFAHAGEIRGRDNGKWIFESTFATLKNKTGAQAA